MPIVMMVVVVATALDLAPPYAAALASKGRLIRCTVPGSTPNCLAIDRTPGGQASPERPVLRFSSSGAIRGPAKLLALAPGPRQARTDSFLNDRPLELGKHAHHLKHRLAGRRRGVDALLVQEQVDLARAARTGSRRGPCRLRPSRSTDQAITTSNCRLVASRQSASNAAAGRGPWRR